MGDIYNTASLFEFFFLERKSGFIWTDSPTTIGLFVNSILVPVICLFGIVGNSICLLVLYKDRFICSFFVYLRVLALIDAMACFVIFVSGLARGLMWWRKEWIIYDTIISIPLGSFLSYLSTISTVFVTIDRVVYLNNPLNRTKPDFCKRKAAKSIISIGTLISIIFSMPYCFIYQTDGNSIKGTPFYKSRFYAFYNWLDFAVFAILPFILLLIGNFMLSLSIKSAHKLQNKSLILLGKIRRIKDQSKLTITLISIVCFYLVAEIPTHLTHRKTAANLLFGGDYEKAESSVILDKFRLLTTVLHSLYLAGKIVCYFLLCPNFSRAFKKVITRKSMATSSPQITEFPLKLLLTKINRNGSFKTNLKEFMITNVFIIDKTAQDMPRIV